MSSIKHWGRRYDAAEENICSEPGCMNGAVEFDRGQPKCVRHLSLRLEVSSASRGPRMSTIRRLG